MKNVVWIVLNQQREKQHQQRKKQQRKKQQRKKQQREMIEVIVGEVCQKSLPEHVAASAQLAQPEQLAQQQGWLERFLQAILASPRLRALLLDSEQREQL